MKNYINSGSEVYSYEDDVSQEFLDAKIEELGLTLISDADLAELRLPTAEELIQVKWKDLDVFLSSLTVTTNAGNKFDVSPNGIINITQRINTMTDADTDTWYEDWGNFTVNKVELQEALVKQSEDKKAKITELFGVI